MLKSVVTLSTFFRFRSCCFQAAQSDVILVFHLLVDVLSCHISFDLLDLLLLIVSTEMFYVFLTYELPVASLSQLVLSFFLIPS